MTSRTAHRRFGVDRGEVGDPVVRRTRVQVGVVGRRASPHHPGGRRHQVEVAGHRVERVVVVGGRAASVSGDGRRRRKVIGPV